MNIPEKTSVVMNGAVVSVKGPKGELSREFKTDVVAITIDANMVTFLPVEDSVFARALWGTYASHVKNMIAGVNEGFVKKLILEGVGFKSDVAGKKLNLALGFSHPVKIPVPAGLTVTADKNLISISAQS